MSTQRTLSEIDQPEPFEGQEGATCWDWALANGWIDTGGKR